MRAWLDDPENKLHMESFQASMESLRNFRKESVVRVGSVCTGWGVGDMVVGAITAILADRCDLNHRILTPPPQKKPPRSKMIYNRYAPLLRSCMVNSGQNRCANDISLNKACEGIWLARDEQFITLNKV